MVWVTNISVDILNGYNKTYMAYIYNHAVQGNKKWFLTSFWAWCKQQQPCPSFEPSRTAHLPPCTTTTVIQPMYIHVCDNYNRDITSLHSWVYKIYITNLRKAESMYHHSIKLYLKISRVCCRLYCYKCYNSLAVPDTNFRITCSSANTNPCMHDLYLKKYGFL